MQTTKNNPGKLLEALTEKNIKPIMPKYSFTKAFQNFSSGIFLAWEQ